MSWDWVIGFELIEPPSWSVVLQSRKEKEVKEQKWR